MNFTSLEFLAFFPVVLTLYFVLPHPRRWLLLLLASYYFYMSWRPEYLALILVSTLVDYLVGLRLEHASRPSRRRGLLIVSLATNLGLLFAFKYFNFLTGELRALLASLGVDYTPPALDVLLPVGISFYTFQTLSYTIDVYRGSRPAERHLGIFALYVSFFPQLVAGPIERSTRLLPQLSRRQAFDWERIVDGLELMLWGLFKKIVVADRLAVYVDQIYGDPAAYPGAPLILATYFFAFQIYCDFSAYSDIAKGAARTMGIELMDNFRFPYLARSVTGFWHRWHISLSTWFRDYLYVPLGGNRVRRSRWVSNILVVFLLSGLWHGASWTFLVWGALHAVYVLGSRWTHGLRASTARLIGLVRFPALHRAFQVLITFHLVLLGWVFFRAESFGDALSVLRGMTRIDPSQLGINVYLPPAGRWQIGGVGRFELLIAFGALIAVQLVEYLQRSGRVATVVPRDPLAVRWLAAATLIVAVLLLGSYVRTPFIYFQF